MLSATTIGRPSSMSWLTRYRLRWRLLASTTTTTTSGAGVSDRSPRSTSIAICSSGERLIRLYVPGRSITSTVVPSGSLHLPVFFSTVTPG